MRIYLLFIAALMILLSFSGCARFSYVEKRQGYKHLKQPYVRVKIIETSILSLECTGPYELHCIHSDGSATDYSSNSDLLLKIDNAGINVKQESGLPLENELMRVVAIPRDTKDHLLLNGGAFRGVADVIIENDSISIVNAVYMEDYLKGVLPPEIGRHGKPELEALKAQAVASRTYALSRFKRNPAKLYDMVNHISDQVYIGMSGEDRWINRAIKETHGEVLLAGGELITAYYHSTCGGFTDNIEDVWDRQPKSYLKGCPDEGFCRWSKFYNWSFTWSRRQLETSISDYLRQKKRLTNGDIHLENLKVIDRLHSGRIKILKVYTDIDEFLLFKDQIRWALIRPDKPGAILPSTNFQIEVERDTGGEIIQVTATGQGNGHGVGMCQCGALGRSRAGQKYRHILAVYYTGADVSKVY